MPNIEEKRRIVRGLLGAAGRGFAEECGFRVTNNTAKLFQLLYLSILLSGSDDYRSGSSRVRSATAAARNVQAGRTGRSALRLAEARHLG